MELNLIYFINVECYYSWNVTLKYERSITLSTLIKAKCFKIKVTKVLLSENWKIQPKCVIYSVCKSNIQGKIKLQLLKTNKNITN